jgi:hypothetical protein
VALLLPQWRRIILPGLQGDGGHAQASDAINALVLARVSSYEGKE